MSQTICVSCGRGFSPMVATVTSCNHCFITHMQVESCKFSINDVITPIENHDGKRFKQGELYRVTKTKIATNRGWIQIDDKFGWEFAGGFRRARPVEIAKWKCQQESGI